MPRKLGQHFLIRRDILERLAAAACPEPEPLVIEIGPGRGALTEFLLARAARVVAVELDSGLAAGLREKFREAETLEVVERDVLETNLADWGPAVVAGNLPYYITSPIIEKVIEMGPLLRRAVLMVQKEVADRITASPGRRDYGYLTVATNLFTVPETILRVPPSAFAASPKGDSAAVLLTPRPPGAWNLQNPTAFLEFAGRAFRQKRKTLRNNLAAYYGNSVGEWPEAGLRAEQLPVEKLIELYRRTGGK